MTITMMITRGGIRQGRWRLSSSRSSCWSSSWWWALRWASGWCFNGENGNDIHNAIILTHPAELPSWYIYRALTEGVVSSSLHTVVGYMFYGARYYNYILSIILHVCELQYSFFSFNFQTSAVKLMSGVHVFSLHCTGQWSNQTSSRSSLMRA